MNDKEKFEEEALAEFLEMTGIPKEKIDQYERIRRVVFPAYGETYELKTPGLVVLFKSNSPDGLWSVLYFPKKPHDVSEPFINKSCVSEKVCEHDKNVVLDKIRAEIEQTASRYSISSERGGMGQVEWSDRLIKESEVLKILDKYKEDRSVEE